jgi:hypothetical protein
MLQQIDQACAAAGIWPDLHLSGHAHLYERYTRTVNGKQIPYLVAGMGGYYNLPGLKPGNKPPAPTTPASGTDASGNPLTIQVYNDSTFGFMRMTISPAAITGEFISVDPATRKTGVADSFTLDLKANTVSNGPVAAPGASTGSAAKASATAQPKAKAAASAKTPVKAKTPAKVKIPATAKTTAKAKTVAKAKTPVKAAPVKAKAKAAQSSKKPGAVKAKGR